MKIAVIGSGISGLTAAHRLRGKADITLYEANNYFGGHSHTVDVTLTDTNGQAVTYGVDTGFLVFNERTYPGLIALFKELSVSTTQSDMSFSVQVPGAGTLGANALEWNGANLATVFSQKRNLLRPRFWRMLADLVRFNRLCTRLAEAGKVEELRLPLESFLNKHGFGEDFRNWYLLPMLGCIWSCPTNQMLRFPVETMIRFCHNHGLIQINNRPQWFTVTGGSRNYVQKITDNLDARLSNPVVRIVRDQDGIDIHTNKGVERFNAVVIAVHSDQALKLLEKPTSEEQKILGSIRYQPNHAVLHTDYSVMPSRKSAWGAWNYERTISSRESASVCLHYWLNRLQPLPFNSPVLVSLNPNKAIEPSKVIAEFDYDHPVFDLGAISAQELVPELQGLHRTWYCGAWTKYGFHEDGLQSGYRAADLLLAHMHN